jgi:hypothetical protein
LRFEEFRLRAEVCVGGFEVFEIIWVGVFLVVLRYGVILHFPITQ